MPPEALAAAWSTALPGARVRAVADAAAAIEVAIAEAPGPVVVAGSLYLVGVARALLVDDPDLRDPVAA
jgi:folylpolyglutamate synthase/dihydropteroate synthase